MHYTEEQFQKMAPHADEFRRAIESNYCKHPGTPQLKEIRAAYMAATGVKFYPENYGCTACVIQLMKDAGRLYFEDCDARAIEAAKREAERVAAAAKLAQRAANAAESDAPKAESVPKPSPKKKTAKSSKK